METRQAALADRTSNNRMIPTATGITHPWVVQAANSGGSLVRSPPAGMLVARVIAWAGCPSGVTPSGLSLERENALASIAYGLLAVL
ncbi:MAG: hypothetical protein ACOVNV_00210 [Pirellulaceae bacterium]